MGPNNSYQREDGTWIYLYYVRFTYFPNPKYNTQPFEWIKWGGERVEAATPKEAIEIAKAIPISEDLKDFLSDKDYVRGHKCERI